MVAMTQMTETVPHNRGDSKGEDVTLIYWATGWGEAERPELPVSSYIVSSCRRRARLKEAFSAGLP